MQNLRRVFRTLIQQPGFTSLVVLTLALGIGATSAVFSLIHGVLLTPPPYLDPEEIVLVSSDTAEIDPGTNPLGFAALQWMEWRKHADAFEAIAAYDWTFNFLVLEDGSQALEGMRITPDYFRVTGLDPVLGRAFGESDTAPDASPVILLGYDVWLRTFDADPDIQGQTIRVSRQETPRTIVGVMPPGIRFLPTARNAREPNYDVDATVDFWIPQAPDPEALNDRDWSVLGRLREGATLQDAEAELAVLLARQARLVPEFEGQTARVQALTEIRNRAGRDILLPLLLAAGLVLMISCGNVAAVLLVRGLQRQREYGVRGALGAGRASLFRLVATESLALALLGGGLGVGLAFLIVEAFKQIGRHAIPRLDMVTTDWPVLACGLGAAVVAAVVAGLYPALRASWLNPVKALRSAGSRTSAGRGERRLLRSVVTAQISLTLSLLIGAGLLIRTMYNLSSVSSGFDTGHVLTMSVTSMQSGEPEDYDSFHRLALERVSALPGVERAAFAWGVPLTGNAWPFTVALEGQPDSAAHSEGLRLPARAITPGYFELLGLRVTEGRDFRSIDSRESQRVAIVNQALVDKYFADIYPLGQGFTRFGGGDRFEIVGVVGNGRTVDLTQPAEPEIYLSLFQAAPFSKHLVVRTVVDPLSLASQIRQELRFIEPTVAVLNVETLDQIRGGSQAVRAFALQLLVGFAAIASALTLGGVYGVLSLTVASRRREIAIRAAVGADRRSLRQLIMGEGLKLVGAGVLGGLVAALPLSRVLEAFLFEVASTDGTTMLGAALALAVVALAACWLPASRAARANPNDALRED